MDAGLLVLLAAAIVVSLQTVGLLMSVAMLVTPAASARLRTARTATMTIVAMVLGVAAAALGLTASYHLDTPPGATVSLAAVAMLAGSFLLTVSRRVHRHPATLSTGPP